MALPKHDIETDQEAKAANLDTQRDGARSAIEKAGRRAFQLERGRRITKRRDAVLAALAE